ncbi:hypothetical protein CC80DRAFT_327974 [Byssothecium circinans]|uniref:Heterokaryon incompatibility domain-containing protein n=1 Tax=Byssothecium circinans TaxID=147558 RepID=A0A6A5T940_9PLEO|nr:hypothetical protein CC80DRAFT_327974 [Byssothecium circinans]
MLSLCSSNITYDEPILPDYETQPEALFKNVCRNEILHFRSIWPLVLSPIKLHYPKMPSWAIDWTAFPVAREKDDDTWLHIFHRSMACKIPKEIPTANIQFRDENLQAECLSVDRISACVYCNGYDAFTTSETLCTMTNLIRKRYSITDQYPGDASMTYHEAWMTVLCADSLNKKHHEINIGPKLFARSDKSDFFWVVEAARLSLGELRAEFHGINHSQSAFFKSSMVSMVYSYNAMFITEKGYLGIAKGHSFPGNFSTEQLVAGDGIFILPGGKVPFVLRKAEAPSRESAGNANKNWKVVGTCYLQGFMYGEHNAELFEEQGGYTAITII